MDRGIPSFNRVVVAKMQEHHMQTHYQKLLSIQRPRRPKPLITPQPRYNLKKHQTSEDRSTQIDKNNVLLFQKMKKIMSRADPLNTTARPHRLNSNRFATHIQRINDENQQILERLLRLKPTIDNKKIQEERKKQLAILKSLGRHSYCYKSSAKTEPDEFSSSQHLLSTEKEDGFIRSQKRKVMESSAILGKHSLPNALPLNARPRYSPEDNSRHEPDELKEAQAYFQREMLKLAQRRRRVNTFASQTSNRQPLGSESPRRRTSVSKNILLFATFKKIGSLIYKVEINRKHNAYQVICIDVTASDRILSMEISESEGNQLLSKLDYDYQFIVDCLHVGKEIWLDREKLGQSKQCGQLPAAIGMKKRLDRQEKELSHITQQPNQSSIHLDGLLYPEPH